MNIIAAADSSWGIGKNGDLLEHIPEDMKFFRSMTKGKTMIMGRKTFLSLPNERPLSNRVNLVVTSDRNFRRDGIIVCHSMEEAVCEARRRAKDRDIFFIGGAEIYREAAAYCDTAYITKIGKKYDADVFLPNFDELPGWRVAEETPLVTEGGLNLKFCIYKKE